VVTLHRMSIRLEDNRPGLRVVIEFELCESAAAASSASQPHDLCPINKI
jgi:hypothetical protein